MADEGWSGSRGAQDTGNPVLDSLANIVSAEPRMYRSEELIRALHELLVELAQNEPGGLKRRTSDGKFLNVTSES